MNWWALEVTEYNDSFDPTPTSTIYEIAAKKKSLTQSDLNL